MSVKITLEAARVNSGYTIQEAAEKFGVHWQTLSAWEKDSSRIKYHYIKLIPKIYNIPLDDIFFGKLNEYFSSRAKNNTF